MKGRMCALFLATTLFALMFIQNLPASPANKIQTLTKEELDQRLPASVFLDGENAMVQRRNSVGARMEDGKLLLVTFVDTSGFASDYQQKYVGMLMAQGNVRIGQAAIGPGAYGLGRRKTEVEGKESLSFVLYDLGGNQVAEMPATRDDELRPVMVVQLKAEPGIAARLYLGRYYVTISSR